MTPCFFFVSLRKRKADVHQCVIADTNFRHVLQTDPLDDTAEIDFAHQNVMLVIDLDYLTGNSEAHGPAPHFLLGTVLCGTDCQSTT